MTLLTALVPAEFDAPADSIPKTLGLGGHIPSPPRSSTGGPNLVDLDFADGPRRYDKYRVNAPDCNAAQSFRISPLCFQRFSL